MFIIIAHKACQFILNLTSLYWAHTILLLLVLHNDEYVQQHTVM